MKILVINAGSSSLKYQLIDMTDESVLAKGNCDRIGIDGLLKHKSAKAEFVKEFSMPNHSTAVRKVIEVITDKEIGCISSLDEISAVGHRIVHGGEHFKEAKLVNEAVIDEIAECGKLAPLHNVHSVSGIRACMEVLPNVPHVVVFDTAFHQTMPPEAYMYGVPYDYYKKYAIRKYGFHGTSHRFVTQRAAAMLGKDVNDVNLITCHLGNGSSITAVKNGKCIDTTMGFTPLDGLMMGSRCGAMDPAVVTYIERIEGKTSKEMDMFMNKECGVLGISGVSSDFRDIDDAVAEGNERAKLALDMFIYQIKKYIGSFMYILGKIDGIVFTAGVGENNPELRQEVLKGLQNIHIDSKLNNIHGKETIISTPDSAFKIMVIPTNEECMIARDTKQLVESLKK
ncbi:MAG: acetate kinase [Bacillota bacterium]|nr:acetate kinase [Bacillota bacterium]